MPTQELENNDTTEIVNENNETQNNEVETPEAVDIDSLSDEEFEALSPDDVLKLMEEPEDGNTQENNDGSEGNDGSENTNAASETPEETQNQDPENPGSETPPGENKEPTKPESQSQEKPEVPESGSETVSQNEPAKVEELTEEQVKARQDEALNFFEQLTKPFKADGKEITIRSAEEGIRLMQQGVNYSRRMEEIKPMRQMMATLNENGLDDASKLGFAIDLLKGKPEAIQKLLKEKDIDPIDIDVSKEPTYQDTDYSVDPGKIDFQLAIEETLKKPGGPELIGDINSDWDDMSKEALRESPIIFENLLAHRDVGMYSQITKELNHQRAQGYLTNVPFLQAYHQVGDAMQKAGVFGPESNLEQSTGMAPIKKAPIDTGPRKAAVKPKNEQPNQDVSSLSNPKAKPDIPGEETVPDYSTMSDAEFLKAAAPG